MPSKVGIFKSHLPSVCVLWALFLVSEWLLSLLWTDFKITCHMCLTYQNNMSGAKPVSLPLRSRSHLAFIHIEMLHECTYEMITIQ